MKRKGHRPVRGEVLFKGIAAVEIPYEGSITFAIYSEDGAGCRLVYEREHVYAQFPLSTSVCEGILDAYRSISPPPQGEELDDQQDDCYGE